MPSPLHPDDRQARPSPHGSPPEPALCDQVPLLLRILVPVLFHNLFRQLSLLSTGMQIECTSRVALSPIDHVPLVLRLHAYVHDFLVKKGLDRTAALLVDEYRQRGSETSEDARGQETGAAGLMTSVPIDVGNGGFLLEWWCIFWDIFNARSGGTTGPATPAAFQYAQVTVHVLVPIGGAD
jgi:hypothetical protein